MKEKIKFEKVKASDVSLAKKRLRKKYPLMRVVCYKFVKDFRFEYEKDYRNRMMSVAFIEDYRRIRKEL